MSSNGFTSPDKSSLAEKNSLPDKAFRKPSLTKTPTQFLNIMKQEQIELANSTVGTPPKNDPIAKRNSLAPDFIVKRKDAAESRKLKERKEKLELIKQKLPTDEPKFPDEKKNLMVNVIVNLMEKWEDYGILGVIYCFKQIL